ncbi:HTTM domain-containing protein [Microbacterium invictum]|uniref:HTTM domain-containing protein n=1 Tax=Microbacterium invictum TaxID=515415 RepID=A0ABZ0VCC2_9MICO|nr:HTTM domain-containing protein [Microbacterium invictum]WQB69780.1 HTTM domain-containing protein [Microbacterium invictum]
MTTAPAPRAASLSLTSVWNRTVQWVTGTKHAVRSMSALRILFGIAILWLLLTSAADRHYLWGAGSVWVDPAVDRRGYPDILRVFFPKDDAALFDLSYATLVALTTFFIVGIGTRVVTPLLLVFWVALSTNSVYLTNGGDVVIRLVLLFCVFADLSQHWSVDAWLRRMRGPVAARRSPARMPPWLGTVAHNTVVVLCAYQVILVYVNSGILKLMGSEWREGSALYYAFHLDVFRVFPALSDLAGAVVPFVVVGSWVSVVAQIAFPVLLLWRPTRYAALVVLMGMHLSIGLLLGLWPFSLAMIALDLVFIRDRSWDRAWRTVTRRPFLHHGAEQVP